VKWLSLNVAYTRVDVGSLAGVDSDRVEINSISEDSADAADADGGRRRLEGAAVVDFTIVPAADGTPVAVETLTTAFAEPVSLPSVGASTASAVTEPVLYEGPVWLRQTVSRLCQFVLSVRRVDDPVSKVQLVLKRGATFCAAWRLLATHNWDRI
jgi:hypothetical protein